MGSIAIVLILLAAGVLIGRLAGRSQVAQCFLAFVAAVFISAAFYVVVLFTT